MAQAHGWNSGEKIMIREALTLSAILFVVFTASLTAAFAIDRWLHPDPVWIEMPAGVGV